LGECIESILSQTYGDFEILIMDDCSPDNTGEVARSFVDPRVKYIRNDPNLGHLKNYNKGIGLSRGAYVWLISADDRLAKPYALERYMAVMEANPQVGYAFCPALEIVGGKEAAIAKYTHGERDAVLAGKKFVADTLMGVGNAIPAASGLVRKECYERVCLFPLDMPYGGDWYLWCMFALHYDAAYLAEPMVNYRIHELAMCRTMSQENIRLIINDDIGIPWRIRQEAERLGARDVVQACFGQLAAQFGRYLSGSKVRGTAVQITLEEFETRLAALTSDAAERRAVAAASFASAGDRFFWRDDFTGAADMYRRALSVRPFWPKIWARAVLSRTSTPRAACRRAVASLRSLKLKTR
jgi:glycosyltransferase involved in cell wall biosynthesis